MRFCPAQSTRSLAVADMAWSNAQRAFVVEAFIRNNDLVVAAQRAFHTQFQIPSCASVPDRKSILSLVANFKGTGSVVKKRGCRPRRACTYLNRLMQFNIQFCSLHYARLANMQLLSTILDYRSVPRILRLDLHNFSPI